MIKYFSLNMLNRSSVEKLFADFIRGILNMVAEELLSNCI